MKSINLDPLKETLSNFAFQLFIFALICAAAYVGTRIILNLFKIPKMIADLLATAVLLLAAYYSFLNGYIPGISSTQ
ncbi:hypothetical protein [Bacillus sp. Hm123]|uniref:hypothetical protein n=1 Tax=Bacillus sp. Hm123 TaxID=3450745 RepID=UPI003F443CB2